MAITLHRAHNHASAGTYLVQTQPSACSESGDLVHVLSSFGASVGDVSQMLQWNRMSEYTLSLPHLSSQAAGKALQMLVDAKAFEGRHPGQFLPRECFDADLLAEPESMAFEGWVSHCDAGWQLKQVALQQMCISQRLATPSVLATLPDEALPLTEYTTFQLRMKLESLGWVWQRAKPFSIPAAHRQGGLRVWYTSGVTVHREYLAFLAGSHQMLAEDPGYAVAHLQPVKYYRCLLQGDMEPRLCS